MAYQVHRLGYLFGLIILTTVATARAQETKIGVIIVQTGPLAQIGKGIVNAVVLASEQKDPRGQVKFIFEDDGFQAAKAVSAAEKLIAEDHVAALVTFAGAASSAIAPIAEKKRIPLLTISAGDQHTIGKHYIYRVFLSTDQQVDLINAEIARERLSKVAIVTTIQESLVRLRDLLKERAGDAIVADEEASPGDNDMQGLVTRINSNRPDAVVLYLLPPQLGQFSKALRAQGFRGKLYGGIQLYNFPQVVASDGALIGAIFPAPAVNEKNSSFYREYEQRFHESLASEQEVYGYDVAATLISASTSGDIQNYLQSLKEIHGLAGTYPRRDNNFFEVPAILKRIASNNSVKLLDSE